MLIIIDTVVPTLRSIFLTLTLLSPNLFLNVIYMITLEMERKKERQKERQTTEEIKK